MLYYLLNLAVMPMILAAPPADLSRNEQSLIETLNSVCGSKSQIQELYPADCHGNGKTRIDQICFLVLDYIIQGCSNTTAKLPAAKEISCPMQNLSAPKTFVNEAVGVYQYLKDEKNCSAECKLNKNLCEHLIKLNDWLQLPKNGSTPTTEKLEAYKTDIPQNSQQAVSLSVTSKQPKVQSPVVETVTNKTQKVSKAHVSPTPSPAQGQNVADTEVKPESGADKSQNDPAEPSGPKDEAQPVQQPSPVDTQGVNKGGKNEQIDDLNEEPSAPAEPLQNGYSADDFEEGAEPDKVDKPIMGAPDPEDEGEDYNMVRSEQPNKAEILDDLKKIPRITTNGAFQDTPDSHFFFYFISFVSLSAVAYIAFHNKNKIFAIVLEGRRGRQSRRRPNSAGYRKLDTSLEEAMMSHPSRGTATHVIY